MPRPVALSASIRRSRSIPVAERSRPSGLRPPEPPRSELSEAASWTAWIARDLGHRAAEQDSRDNLVLRQRGRGGEGDLRVVGPAGDGDADLDALDVAGRDEIDLGVGRTAAGEGDAAAIEPEAAAGEAQRAADQFDLADDLGRRGGALDAQIRLPFRFEAHAGDEDPVVGVEADVEPPDARHAGIGRFRARRRQRLAAAAHAGELGHLGRGLADDLVAHLAQIELPVIEAPLRSLTMARLPVATAPISSLRASRAFWNSSLRSIGKPAAEARPIVPRPLIVPSPARPESETISTCAPLKRPLTARLVTRVP